MTSKQLIPVIGLNLTVYGLEEYKQLPEGTPVSIMFALHGRLQNQSKMEQISQALVQLNVERKSKDAHLLVITFDAPNHGSRLNNKLANFAWIEGKHRNPNHATDMWGTLHSTSRTVSELIDVVEYYLFGPKPTSIVQRWGVIGFSMGGHATFLAAANDPRISVAIPVVGIADYLRLMKSRLSESNLEEDVYLPKSFQQSVQAKYVDLDQKLKTKHILIINGEKDVLVKADFNQPLIQSLRKVHVGKEGYDWEYYLVPGVGHAWCPEMIESSAKWTYQWLLKNDHGDSKI